MLSDQVSHRHQISLSLPMLLLNIVGYQIRRVSSRIKTILAPYVVLHQITVSVHAAAPAFLSWMIHFLFDIQLPDSCSSAAAQKSMNKGFALTNIEFPCFDVSSQINEKGLFEWQTVYQECNSLYFAAHAHCDHMAVAWRGQLSRAPPDWWFFGIFFCVTQMPYTHYSCAPQAVARRGQLS